MGCHNPGYPFGGLEPMKEPINVTIRQFTQEDLDAVVSINRKALPENYPSDFFLYCFKACPDGFLLAETNEGNVVGYIMIRVEMAKSNFGFRLTKKGHIISIAVLDEYRRQGIATHLIESMMVVLSERGIKEFYLEVRVSNIAAINLYENLGYEQVKLQKRYYQDGESAYRMAVRQQDT